MFHLVRWICWLGVIGAVLAFLTIISMAVANTARAVPSEPPVETAIGFEPHPSLGGVFEYADGSRFAHPKKGAIEFVSAQPEETITVYLELREVWVITEGGIWYTLDIVPTFYLDEQSGSYLSMISQTWPPCGCGE